MGIINFNIASGNEGMASFEANLNVLYDDALGYLIDWKITFTNAIIDTKTTSSWFGENSLNPTVFTFRENLFKVLQLPSQTPRNGKNDHNLITLNGQQLLKCSNFFNSSNYNSTIYNVVGTFKGSNPSGAYKNADSAQLWETETGNNFNINIFFRYFVNSQDPNSRQNIVNNEKAWLSSQNNINTLSFYLQQYQNIETVFKRLQDNNETKITMEQTKRLAKRLMENIQKVNADANREWQNYSRQIRNRYGGTIQALSLVWGTQQHNGLTYENAHIVPRWHIRKKMLEFSSTPQKYNEWLSKISDPLNFLPLDANAHNNGYDAHPAKLYWDRNGRIVIVNKEWGSLYQNVLADYANISSSELQVRQWYLNYYNDNKLFN